MAKKVYDVAIVGGGINGAAIACYAASRGLSVILLEKKLCGRQTTAGSSRLIHGGLRYLSYNVDTTLSSCVDSGLIIRIVPHLVRRQVFVMPIFEEERRIIEFAEAYLELYDQFQPLKGGMPHVRLSQHDVRALIPGISSKVIEGLTFDEWLIDPVALVQEHVAAARAQGAEILENTEVKTILHDRSGLFILKMATGGEKKLAVARTLINATGPWADKVAGLLGLRISLRPTKGVHLILKGEIASLGLISKIGPNAYVLVSPFGGATLIGPTDDDAIIRNPDALTVLSEEKKLLLDALEKVLPNAIEQHPLIDVTVALRALPNEPVTPKKISRDFQIICHEKDGIPGAISVFSGKMSEYHLMASRVVEQVGRFLRGNEWQSGLYVYRLPDLAEISLQPNEHRQIKMLINDFQPSTRRFRRQTRSWLYLAKAFLKHWPKKVLAPRRGLAVFNKTYTAVFCSRPPTQSVKSVAIETVTLCNKLRAIAGADRVSTEKNLCRSLAKDKWPRLFWKSPNDLVAAVVQPETSEEVAKILIFADQNKTPVVTYGAGSGVCGAVVPDRPVIALDMRRFNQIDVSVDGLSVTSGAGVRGDYLEKILNEHIPPFTLGHFPASIKISSVGGWLGTRSSGQESTKYGNIDDMVVSLEMVFPNGEIREISGQEARKFIGSEGILGVFTRVTFRVHSFPESRYFCAYSFNSFTAGFAALEAVVKEGLRPNVVRLYDALDSLLAFPKDKSSDSHRTSGKIFSVLRYASLINRLTWLLERLRILKPTLILMTSGKSETAAEEFNLVHQVLTKYGAKNLGEKPARLWYEKRFFLSDEMLKNIFENDAFVNTLDFGVEWEKLPETYNAVRMAVSPYAICFAHVSHLSQSGACLYVTYAGKGKRGENEALYDAARDAALGACVAFGSRIEHHHAVGLEKLRFWKKSDPERYGELKTLKKEFDPNNIMNPGKLIVD